jgi:hypothetical protein
MRYRHPGIAAVLAILLPAVGGARQTRLPSPADAPPAGFERVILLEQTAETSANVSLGDLDGDTHLDVVLAKGRHWPLVDRVLLGDGRGGFPRTHDLGPASDRSYSGSLADLDGDGDLDVVISNDTPDPKRVYLNDGRGVFAAGTTFGRPDWETRNATVADVDGDGRPDIVVANRTDKERGNYICLNRGGGRFDAECTRFSRESATTITAADMNGDGLIDLVVPHRDRGQSHLYLRQRGSALAFTAKPFGPPDAAIRMSGVADLDRDGHPDIIGIDERRGVAVFYGEAAQRFSSPVAIGGAKPVPYAMTIADLNKDGAPDVVVGYVEARSSVFFNDGTGRRFTPMAFGDAQGTVYGFAVGDVDEDGQLDIAAARSEAPNVIYLAGRAGPRR